MRTTGFRSMVLYLLLAAFLGGLGYFLFNFAVNGDQWAMQPYNGHVYSENSTVKLGDITDRDGNLLATTEDGVRIYSGDETVRRALLHTVGDPYGYISTSVQYTMRAKLSGYNIVTGLNDTIFNRMGSDIALTIDQDACVAAYNALGGKNGGVIVYNYETGEVLVKVSAPSSASREAVSALPVTSSPLAAQVTVTVSSPVSSSVEVSLSMGRNRVLAAPSTVTDWRFSSVSWGSSGRSHMS